MAPRSQTPSALFAVLLGALACSPDPQESPAAGSSAAGKSNDAAKLEPAPATEPKPEPANTSPAPKPILVPTPIVEADPVVAERKQALANVGRSAFDALKLGDFAALLELTPIDAGSLRDACPSMALSPRKELEARFDHCHDAIAWDAVRDAQVFAGKPTGTPASGCEAGIEDYGRIQLFVQMTDETIWRVELFGAVGKDGNVIGINGEVACATVDEIPPS